MNIEPAHDPHPAASAACHDPDVIEQAVHVAANAMFLADRSGRICWVNSAFTRLYGFSAHEILGQTPRVLKSGRQSNTFYRELWTTIRAGRIWRGHLCNRHKDGAVLDVDQTITPVCDDRGEVTHYFVIYEDITERLRSEQQLTQLAMFDSLTGLPNRNQFHARLIDAMARARRTEHPIAVLLVDLDHFKNVNDTLGHAGGDELLCQVGRTMASTLRDTDLVARLSGDEFAVVLEGITLPDQAIDSAQRLIEVLSSPFKVNGTSVQIGASIGIAVSGAADETSESLLKNADLAMYQAKGRGRLRFQFFDAAMDLSARRRHEMRESLRQALRDGSLSLGYQPQVDLRSGRMVGAEALLRWNHPQRGPIPAADFIGIAEQDGMIAVLNDWVLQTALAQIAALHSTVPSMPPVAVNISAGQFERADLATMIEALLERHGLPGSVLHLEITETLMLRSSLTVHENLRLLSQLGVLISVDDFGTGYSSLPSLREFPIHAIKLDMGYVRGIGKSDRDERLLSGMIALAQKLGLKIIAEGVETISQRDFLLREGCTVAQGHLYAPALPASQFSAWIMRNRLGHGPTATATS